MVNRTTTPVAAPDFDYVVFCRVTVVLPRCAVGDIAKPFVRVDDLDINTVADFCELFAEASGPFRGKRGPDETLMRIMTRRSSATSTVQYAFSVAAPVGSTTQSCVRNKKGNAAVRSS